MVIYLLNKQKSKRVIHKRVREQDSEPEVHQKMGNHKKWNNLALDVLKYLYYCMSTVAL